MNNGLFFIIGLSISLLFSSCSRDEEHQVNMTLQHENDSLSIKCLLYKVGFLEEKNEKPRTYIYGVMKITNRQSYDSFFNLRNSILVTENGNQSVVCYDTFVDILIRDTPIKGNKTIEHRVYWAFIGRLGQKEIETLSFLKK